MACECLGKIGYAAIVDFRIPRRTARSCARRPVAITDLPAKRSYSTSQSQDTSRPSAAAESIASTTVWDCASGNASAQPAGFLASRSRAVVFPKRAVATTGRRRHGTHPDERSLGVHAHQFGGRKRACCVADVEDAGHAQLWIPDMACTVDDGAAVHPEVTLRFGEPATRAIPVTSLTCDRVWLRRTRLASHIGQSEESWVQVVAVSPR